MKISTAWPARCVAACVALSATSFAWAQDDAQTQSRVARLTASVNSVVYAPAGETEWIDLPAQASIGRGDRLWTDQGSRAELTLDATVLRMDGQTFVDITELDEDAMQVALNKGTLDARVRRIRPGENVEIDTPQLAFRATRPGEFRVDVDAQAGITQVTVRSGAGVVFGAGGEVLNVQAADAVAFKGQHLQPAQSRIGEGPDSFGQWTSGRNAMGRRPGVSPRAD